MEGSLSQREIKDKCNSATPHTGKSMRGKAGGNLVENCTLTPPVVENSSQGSSNIFTGRCVGNVILTIVTSLFKEEEDEN